MIISIVFIVFITSFSLYKRYVFINKIMVNTWNAYSWYNFYVQDVRQYEKIIVTWFSLSKIDKTTNDYPRIKINKPIKEIQLVAEITFTKNFIDKYKYEDSPSYFFGLKFFLWDFDNGGYYNVYRKQNWWVGNSPKNNLFGAKPANEIRDWTTRYIPLTDNVPIWVDAGSRTLHIPLVEFII